MFKFKKMIHKPWKSIWEIGVYYDVDGVLNNFWKAICKEAGLPIQFITTWDCDEQWYKDTWLRIKDDYDFWANLPLLNPPEMINTQVAGYMTSLPPRMELARMHCLEKNKFPKAPLIVTHNKLKTCLEVGADLLIDDKNSTVMEINKAYNQGKCNTRALKYVPYYMNEKPTKYDFNNLYKVDVKLKELGWLV